MTDSERTCDYTAWKEKPTDWNGNNPEDWILDRSPPLGLIVIKTSLYQ
jgi:hypothetical protein